ncbi:hypothetical protein B0T21DRAFT_373274 [Apiosordaria backusii]|uniref:Uncharacterized protein n=1 Tax=Apiosordaria backusii TaxID=314023 RepID=A0AA40ASK8_9PEZI|nr:hypothetical protein B0T21DRAFT_373274 [Apiosordaria backusii]
MKDSLKFLCELPIYQKEQPYQLVGYPDQEATSKGENCVFEVKEIDVRDAREHSVTIDSHGFAFFHFKSSCELAVKHFETVGGDNTVLAQYLEETVEFVRSTYNPVDVICFDWRLRRRDPKTGPGIPPRDLKDIRNYALPSGDVVHCDYSADGGLDRLKIQLLPNELTEYIEKGRKAMIVNVWRPLNKTVRNAPLLFCDRRTVPKQDLVEVDKVLPDKVEKSYFLYYRDYHQWYTLFGQRSDEVVVFPTWRSDDLGESFANCCPHGAGASQTDNWADPRESVEVRLLLILEDTAKVDTN